MFGRRLKDFQRIYDYQGDATCAADGMCQEKCPVKINTGELIKSIRSEELKKWKKSSNGAMVRLQHATVSACLAAVLWGTFWILMLAVVPRLGTLSVLCRGWLVCIDTRSDITCSLISAISIVLTSHSRKLGSIGRSQMCLLTVSSGSCPCSRWRTTLGR